MTTTLGNSEEFEILQALYDFTATLSQTLSFKRGDLFIFHSSNNIKKNWWNVIDVRGKSGFIPSNYVHRAKVDQETYLRFLNNSIEKLGEVIAKSRGTDKQLELMQELIAKRHDVFQDPNAKLPSKLLSSKSLPESKTVVTVQHARKVEEHKSMPPVPLRASASETKFNTRNLSTAIEARRPSLVACEQGPNEGSPEGTAQMSPYAAYYLVQQVRDETGLSHQGSCLAVSIVAEGLSELFFPGTKGADTFNKFITQLGKLGGDEVPPNHLLDDTQDARTLRSLLSSLNDCKEDDQQRSWALWDDEGTISGHITKLNSTLADADPDISRRVITATSYAYVGMLVEYYQMEERWTIRNLLLDTFCLLCSLDKTVLIILLNSVLPVEIAREMETNLNDDSRLSKPAIVLTKIFSLGEPMPITYFDQLGKSWASLVLKIIEERCDDEIGDIMLTLLLSYNLQFKPGTGNNVTLEALESTPSAKNFTEKVMLLINREVDPVAVLRVHVSCTHSVLKLFKDLFSNQAAIQLFYTNDIKVLIDIIHRQLSDLAPGNEKRTDYLDLCRLVFTNCDQSCFEHRISDLANQLRYILHEEQPAIQQDREIAQCIFTNCPLLPDDSEV